MFGSGICSSKQGFAIIVLPTATVLANRSEESKLELSPRSGIIDLFSQLENDHSTHSQPLCFFVGNFLYNDRMSSDMIRTCT